MAGKKTHHLGGAVRLDPSQWQSPEIQKLLRLHASRLKAIVDHHPRLGSIALSYQAQCHRTGHWVGGGEEKIVFPLTKTAQKTLERETNRLTGAFVSNGPKFRGRILAKKGTPNPFPASPYAKGKYGRTHFVSKR